MAGCAIFGEPVPTAAPAPAPALPPPPVVEVVVAPIAPEIEEVLALLAYNQRLHALSADELRREYQATQQAFARDRSEFSRLRLVLLLCVQGVPWRDDPRLQALLDGAAGRAGPPDSPRRQLLVLLQKLVAERLREQRRADELQQKLDAMLRIERSLRGSMKK